LNRALALRPNHGATRFELGRVAFRQKSYEEALKHLLAATKLLPELSEPRYLLASTYRELGRAEEARREFQRHAELQKKGRDRELDLMQTALNP
jgi:Flp pilus assembly protein TadD